MLESGSKNNNLSAAQINHLGEERWVINVNKLTLLFYWFWCIIKCSRVIGLPLK